MVAPTKIQSQAALAVGPSAELVCVSARTMSAVTDHLVFRMSNCSLFMFRPNRRSMLISFPHGSTDQWVETYVPWWSDRPRAHAPSFVRPASRAMNANPINADFDDAQVIGNHVICQLQTALDEHHPSQPR